MLAHYFSSAFRSLRRRPASAAIKLLALALGLACLLTAHVIGDFFRQADSQWAKAQRTYVIAQEISRGGDDWISSEQRAASIALARYLREDFPQLETVARTAGSVQLRREDGQALGFQAPAVDPEFLDVFDLEMIAGEAALDRPRTLLLSEQQAKAVFGEEDPIGRMLRSGGGVDLTVAGVYRDFPDASHLGRGGQTYLYALTTFDTWAADFIAQNPGQSLWWEQDNFNNFSGMIYVVLPGDGSLSAAELNRRLEDFVARRVPAGDYRIRLQAMPMTGLTETYFNGRIGLPDGLSLVTALYALGILTLAIGCVNFANLSAAEASTRAREIGLMRTVGAGRRQVAAHALAESAILAVTAMLLVLPLTGLIASAVTRRFNFDIPLPGAERLDYWLGVGAIAIAAAVVAGAYPALVLANLKPVLAIRMKALIGGSGAVRGLLIGAQFATASALVVLVTVMLTQNSFIRQTALRLDKDPIIALPVPGQATPDTLESRLEDLRAQLLANPSVTGVTFRSTPPFVTQTNYEMEYAQSLDPSATRIKGQGRLVHYDYFEVVGAELVAGRTFRRDQDDWTSIIIDVGTARAMGFTPAEALGQPLFRMAAATQGAPAASEEFTVIGVIEREPMDLSAEGVTNYLYVRRPNVGIALVTLARNDVDGGLAHVREVVGRLSPNPVFPVFADDLFQSRYQAYAMIIGVFMVLSGIALAIAAMGLFGMASFVVQRRLREVGIRKTLGATTPGVLGLLLWDFSKPVLLANLIAFPVAYLGAQAYLALSHGSR